MTQSNDGEEDDYMTMTFEETPTQKYETCLQRAERGRRERRAKNDSWKSKAQREAEKEAAREAALDTALPSSNKGFKMMAKFGFKEGGTLGKSADARKEPIRVTVKGDKAGIGVESERKRKFRELAEDMERKAKLSKQANIDYREAQREQRKEKKLETDLHKAQKTAERLHEMATVESDSSNLPLHKVNVLWRGLVRDRLEEDRDIKARHTLKNSLHSSRPLHRYHGSDEDDHEKLALGLENPTAVTPDPLDEEDEELAKFEALCPADRLEKVVLFMREKHHYCFWCAYQYPDAAMEGCPGLTEEDHD